MLFASSASTLVLFALASTALSQSTTVSSCPFTPTFVPCIGNAGVDCASMDVPKDWTDAQKTEGYITLRLVRWRATAPGVDPNTAKSIIINPGGPGSSGIDAVVKGGSYYQTVAGPQFNIIGYDPRGVGLNLAYQCTPRRQLKPRPGNNPYAANYFQNAFDYYTDFAAACDEEWGGAGTVQQYGRLISTTQTARDIKAISERVGDKKLRYWGFSYGTVLGATIGNLFRNEIEGLIIDGNINPDDYYTSTRSPVEEASDVDRGIKNFFSQCALAPEGSGANQCAWKALGAERTDQTLLDKWDAWVGADPSKENRGRTSDLSVSQSFIVRNFVFDLLRSPLMWPKGARILQYWYEDQNRIPTTSVNPNTAADPPLGAGRRFMSRQNAGNFNPGDTNADAYKAPNAITGITCVDSRYHPLGLSKDTYVNTYSEYSRKTRYAPDISIGITYGCMPWVTTPKEVFDPNILFKAGGITTSPQPIMVIQTPYDPVTPEASGNAAAAAFSNGVLLKSAGAGHCSSADQSSALLGAIQQYWQASRVPTVRQYYPNQPNPFVSVSVTIPTQPTPSATAPVDSGDGSGDGSTVEQAIGGQAKRRSVDPFAGLVAPELSANVPDYSYMWPVTPVAISSKFNTTNTFSNTTNTYAKASKRQVQPDTALPETIGQGETTATLDPPCDDDTSTTTTGTYSGSSTSTRYGTISTTTTGKYPVSTGYGYGGSSWTKWTGMATPKASSSWDKWTSKSTSSREKWQPTPTESAWGPWKTPDSYEPWKSQDDCVPVTKTNDGKIVVVAVPTKTVYVDYVDDVCETGLYTHTITVTATCNQGCDSKPTGVPQGYTTSMVWCSGCAQPSNVIVTVKIPDNEVKPTQWSAVPVKPAAGTDSWSAWTSTAKPTTNTAAGQWSTWTASPVKPTTATGNGEWNGWGSATTTGLVAKYTGDAAANVIANGVLAAAAFAGLLVL